MHQLIDRIDEHKQVEKDQQQGKGKGKAKVAPPDRRDSRAERFNHNRPRRDFTSHTRRPNAQWSASCLRSQFTKSLTR